MAPHTDSVRLRLHFDYPPPVAAGCRRCWLLVDRSSCRVVADLESLIRETFGFSRGSVLSLFMEQCYLPHTESIYVVRDNDTVSVKVGSIPLENGHGSCQSVRPKECSRKRKPVEEEEEEEEEEDVSVENRVKKKKKKKRRTEETAVEDAKQLSHHESKKKKSKTSTSGKKSTKECVPTAAKKASPEKNPTSAEKPAQKKSRGAPTKPQKTPTSTSTSSSSEPHSAPTTTATKSQSSSSTPGKSAKSTPAQRKGQLSSSSSSDSSSSSSSEEDPPMKIHPKKNLLTVANPQSRPAPHSKPQQLRGPQTEVSRVPPPSADLNSQQAEPPHTNVGEEIEFVIRKPRQQQQRWQQKQPVGEGGPSAAAAAASRLAPGPAGRPKGEGVGGFRGSKGNAEARYNGVQEPHLQTQPTESKAAVTQGVAEAAPKPDYSSMPLLAAPPAVGQRIAFKLLELTENYTPEVSEYKEGKILSFDPASRQMDLELLSAPADPVEPGKFDLVYQNADGSESVEYAVQRGCWVTERWDSLLEPRLII